MDAELASESLLITPQLYLWWGKRLEVDCACYSLHSLVEKGFFLSILYPVIVA